jgi:hypothetical protein
MTGRPRTNVDTRCPPDHKHGATKTCYSTHKCHCEACLAAARKYADFRRKAKAYGRPTSQLVDAQPAREHVWDLRLMGMSAERIAQLAGVNDGVVRSLIYRRGPSAPSKRIRADNAARVLAVELDPDLNARMDPRGTHRRIQALVVQGWSLPRISARLGRRAGGARNILGKGWVTRSTRDRVATVFAELWDKRPPLDTWGDRITYSRTRNYAARMGWVGPLGWDDIDHDEVPAEVRAA